MPDTENKLKAEDVCHNICSEIYDAMDTQGGMLTEFSRENYDKCLETMAWHLLNELRGLDTHEELLVTGHDEESIMELALELNPEAPNSIGGYIAITEPHELNPCDMREIIEFAETLKGYIT